MSNGVDTSSAAVPAKDGAVAQWLGVSRERFVRGLLAGGAAGIVAACGWFAVVAGTTQRQAYLIPVVGAAIGGRVDVEHVDRRTRLPIAEGIVLGHHVRRIKAIRQRGPVLRLRVVGRRRTRQLAERPCRDPHGQIALLGAQLRQT